MRSEFQCLAVGTSSGGTYEETGTKKIQEHLTSAWETAGRDTNTTDTARREAEYETKDECLAAKVAPKTEGKPLVLLKLNCRSIDNKLVDSWN